MVDDAICFLTAVELAAKVRRRELSAVEIVGAFLDRIDRVNPALNAYVTICSNGALEAARTADAAVRESSGEGLPPLHGVPFSVKDLVYTLGVRTTSGSRIHETFVPAADSRSVARLRASGAILMGKTNTPEFGYKATTENLLFGPTYNPWNLERTPGGSSGGAAAATAAGLSPLSVATDGGGSIRIPASFCGVFGLKPTFGLVPVLPGSGGWKTLSHVGPITRTVRDAAVMLDVMAGADEIDRTSTRRDPASYAAQAARPRTGLRLGYSPDLGFARVEPEVARVVEGALGAFEELGHSIERVQLDLGAARPIFEVVVAAENAGAHRACLEEHRALMDEALVKFVERGLTVPAVDYVAATQRRDELAAALAACFGRYDLLLTPTLPVAAFRMGEPPRQIGGIAVDSLGWIPFTYPFNLTGNPAASVPCGRTAERLPVGLQIVAPRHEDGMVLNLAAQFEEARPWAHLRPEIR